MSEEIGTIIPGEDIPVDYEAEASRLGWKPLDDFSGDPSRHVDAKTFYERGQELMPLLKAQNKTLSKRLDAAEKSAKQAAEYFSKAEERAYARAIADIRAAQEAAVESGDLEAHRAASAKLDKLEAPQKQAKADTITPEQRAEDLADWNIDNKWYATNEAARTYADAQADLIYAKKGEGEFLTREDLDAVAAKVKAKFSDKFPEDFGGEASKPKRSAVEGVGARSTTQRGKSFNDLPPEAQRACDKWVKSGTIKSREDYVKSYPW